MDTIPSHFAMRTAVFKEEKRKTNTWQRISCLLVSWFARTKPVVPEKEECETTALLLALECDRYDVVQKLLSFDEAKYIINFKNSIGRSPLLLALTCENPNISENIVKNMLALGAEDKEGYVIEEIILMGSVARLALLLKYNVFKLVPRIMDFLDVGQEFFILNQLMVDNKKKEIFGLLLSYDRFVVFFEALLGVNESSRSIYRNLKPVLQYFIETTNITINMRFFKILLHLYPMAKFDNTFNVDMMKKMIYAA